MGKLFSINVSRYSEEHDFMVYYPASLDRPRANSVMFINQKNLHRVDALRQVKECLVFCPPELKVDKEIEDANLIVRAADPRTAYCLFFRDNGITNYPKQETVEWWDGALIAPEAKIGAGTTVMPFAYIGGEVEIGRNCYIGSGVRLVGRVRIGDNVSIRENSVIGADGLSTDRDGDGKAATMPQFGGVVIEDDVQIGALTVIARGAIDDTIIERGSKIDNSTFISHNVHIGEDTFVVGETIMFGGSSTGERVFISGNATIRNKAKLGDRAFVGMGSVVTKDVPPRAVVFGNPAAQKKGE